MKAHRLCACIVSILLLGPGPVGAVNLTGSWRLFGFFSPGGASTSIVQTGSAIVFTVETAVAPLSGTIDSATGAFTVTGADPLSFSCARFTGTASPDGNSLDATVLVATVLCGGRPLVCTCPFTQPGSHMTGCRTGTGLDCCGDRIVGSTEVCDEGPDPTAGCCTGSCQLAATGTPCVDDTDACTTDVCDAGTCTHPPVPDTDADGICDAADVCPAGAPTERTAIRLGGFASPPGDDRLSVRGTLRLGTPPDLDPVAHGLRVRVEDGHGTALFDVTVPPGLWDGVQGWKPKSRLFRWRSSTPAGGIVTRATVVLPARTPGDVRVIVGGTKGSVTSTEPALPLSATIVLDPLAPATGCADLRFPGPTACRLRGASVRCR